MEFVAYYSTIINGGIDSTCHGFYRVFNATIINIHLFTLQQIEWILSKFLQIFNWVQIWRLYHSIQIRQWSWAFVISFSCLPWKRGGKMWNHLLLRCRVNGRIWLFKSSIWEHWFKFAVTSSNEPNLVKLE